MKRPLRRPRRLGGKDSSQNERAPAMRKLLASAGEVRTFNWKSQCFCGSTTHKFYRRAWWCVGCGREFIRLEGRDYDHAHPV